MKLRKTMMAIALLASAGGANAALVTDTTNGTNEMFLAVWDPTAGKTFNLNTHVTFNQIVANGAAALSSINLALDPLWSTFTNSITVPSAVKFILGVGDATAKSMAVTSDLGIPPAAYAINTNVVTPGATAINKHAAEINAGTTAGVGGAVLAVGVDSTVISDQPDNQVGQFDHSLLGAPANGLWSGYPMDPTGTLGAATSFWFAGHHAGVDARNRPIDIIDANDIKLLGSYNLSLTSLTFTPSAVPLPAAVWMFGAGLMGLLRATRRKSLAA
jgi:hypothetical protein